MSDSPNKNPFSDPDYGSDLTKSSEVSIHLQIQATGKREIKG